MALGDRILDAIGRFADFIGIPLLKLLDIIEAGADVGGGEEDITDQVGQEIEDAQPADDVAEVVVDLLEEAIVGDLQETGEITPENVEGLADDVEGNATALLLGIGLSGTAIEAGSVGQLETQQEVIVQALAGLGLDDVTGTELDARLSEGVLPALEAKVGKEHRAQFVSLPDAVEYALRNKDNDEEYLTASGASADVRETVGSNEPVNRENLLEEWGIRDDQLDILEEVSLEAMEFEELVETPAELGLVVPDDVLEGELDRAGYSEETKAFLSQVNDAIRRSARTYQELLTTEELVRGLDTLVRDGVLSPEDAEAIIPEEVPADPEAFRERFRLLADLPAGTPSATDFEGAFASGYLSLEEFRERLDASDYPTDQFEPVLRKQVLDELDGDLQTAVGLDLLDPATFSDYAEFAGLDDGTIDALLQGQGLDDVAQRRLQQETDPATLSVRTLSGVGESRGAGLRAAGVETIGDMAQADAETVAEAAQVSPETAQGFIAQARQRLS